MIEKYEQYSFDISSKTFETVDKKGNKIDGIRKEFLGDKNFPFGCPKAACFFSNHIGRIVINDLQFLFQQSFESEKKNKIQKNIDWIMKKSIYHPNQVRKEMDYISKHPEFLSYIEKSHRDISEIRQKMRVIGLLHDIGRLCEIDIKNGNKIDLRTLLGDQATHSFMSYEILRQSGFDDLEILLPIKYHEMNYANGLSKDELYLESTLDKQKMIKLLYEALCDADKMANLSVYAVHGCKKAGEMNDPNFSGDYKLTPYCVERIMDGKYFPAKECHFYLDCLLRWISMSFDVNFSFYKKHLAEEVISPVFDKTFEEAQDEWNANPTDMKRYQQTLETLKQVRLRVMSLLGVSSYN